MVPELGRAAAAGALEGGWAVRAERVRALVGHLFGPEGPGGLEVAEPPPPSSGPAGAARARAALEQAARAQLRALFARDVPALAAGWAPVVWVLWPDGSILSHPRDALAAHLGARDGERAPLQLKATRSYVGGEIHAAHARGVGPALRFLGGGPWITTALEGPRLELRRVLLVAEAAVEPARFTTLALGAPDEARVFGSPPSLREPEAVRLAERFVRSLLLRRGRGVLELRGRMTPRFVLDADETSPDELADALDGGGPALDANDAAVERAEPLSARRARAFLGEKTFEEVERRAPERWHRALGALRPEWALVASGRYAPAEERLVNREGWLCLIVHGAEPDGTGERSPRARLALCARVRAA